MPQLNQERELTQEQFMQLDQVLGREPKGFSAEVLDVDGGTLVHEGRPDPAVADLLRPLTHQRGTVTVDLLDAQGPGRRATIWLSRYGILHAVPSPTGTVVLRVGPYGTLYRMLIDTARLQDLPALPSINPISIRRSDVAPELWSEETARLEVCTRIARSLPPEIPEVAAVLEQGRGALVTVAATWTSRTGTQCGGMTWVSTPQGLLIHEAEHSVLRVRHELDTVHPGWMWLRLMDQLPVADDLQYWTEQYWTEEGNQDES